MLNQTVSASLKFQQLPDDTCREVGADEPYWQITPSSWPESLLLQMYRKGIRSPEQLEMELIDA